MVAWRHANERKRILELLMETNPPPVSNSASMPTDSPAWLTPRFMVGATLTVLAVLAIFWAVYRFRYAVFMLFAAMMLRVAIRPAVDKLRSLGLRADVSVMVVFAGLIVLLAGLGALLIPLFAGQLSDVAAKLPNYYADLRNLTLQSPQTLIKQIGAALPADWLSLLPDWDLAAAGSWVGNEQSAPAAGFVSTWVTICFCSPPP